MKILLGLFIFLSSSITFASEESELKRMLENPEAFHAEVADINQGHPRVAAMTMEMANFYTAVAMVEAKNCFLQNDPRPCELFLESMKDPAGHLGFMSFMLAAGKTNEWLMLLTKQKMPQYLSRNIGMMVGMMVQETLIEFLHHPSTQELVKLPWDERYPTLEQKRSRARELKRKLWQDTYGNRDWRVQKGIAGTSLLAAVGLTTGSQFLVKETAKRGVKKFGFKLGKRLMLGSRFVRVATPIGLSITGAVLFLEWSGFTEKFVAQPLREKYALGKLEASISALDAATSLGIGNAEKAAKKVAQNFHGLRQTLMHQALGIFHGHQQTLARISQDFYNLTRYYTWFAEGMNHEEFEENEGQWHHPDWFKDLSRTRGPLIEALFCGQSVAHSIEVKLDKYGLPVPYPVGNSFDVLEDHRYGPEDTLQMRDIKIKPYRLLNIPNTCYGAIHALNTDKYPRGKIPNGAEVYCPLNRRQGNWISGNFRYTNYLGCKAMVDQYRQDLLYSGTLGVELELSNLNQLSILLSRVEKLKMRLIKRYEAAVEKTLKNSLEGQSEKTIQISGSIVKKSVLAVLEFEKNFWKKYSGQTQYAELAALQQEQAQKLLLHVKNTPSKRTYDTDIELLFNLEDWAQMARLYDNFILRP